MGSTQTGGYGTPDSLTTGQVKEWIYKNKQANPDVPYYELWGQLSDELKAQGLNPSNYDKEFWEILHPEGLEGYNKYVKSSGGSEPITNAFI